jgi:uncharacterized protein with von Willebrand factor type A (vWA) domain
VVVGDALMAPYELVMRTDASGHFDPEGTAGIQWLQQLSVHFERNAWLTPEPPHSWQYSTIGVVASVFPMFPLTLEGLGEAVGHLTRGRSRRR